MPRPTPPDSDAFLTALQPHYDDALRYGRGLWASGSPADVEDAFQSALLRALDGFGALRDPDRFRPWFFRIVSREVRRGQRRRPWRRWVPLPPDDRAGPLGLVAAPDPAREIDLLDALTRLGGREREALLLFEVGGFSVEEIRAAQGDRSASAVKSRLSRARSRLRDHLTDPVPPLVPALP